MNQGPVGVSTSGSCRDVGAGSRPGNVGLVLSQLPTSHEMLEICVFFFSLSEMFQLLKHSGSQIKHAYRPHPGPRLPVCELCSAFPVITAAQPHCFEDGEEPFIPNQRRWGESGRATAEGRLVGALSGRNPGTSSCRG